MTRNWALVIGINEYNPLNFTPLKYAKHDAERVRDFFIGEGFEVCYFADDSPPLTLPSGDMIPTLPSYGNLVTFLQDRFESQPGFLQRGDNCWFFFAGHGERHQDRDYLMPIDANSRGREVIAGLTVSYVRERLGRSGADNVIMILDACRSQGGRNGLSIGQDIQKGVITLASCQPSQKSWEIDELGQGAFTYALLEALQLSEERSCATVERLGSYLQQRVPTLCQQYGRAPAQVPRVSVDPIQKQHFILIPKYARQADIDRLKLDVFRLKDKNPNLAEQICIRLNAMAMGNDLEVIDLLTDIRGKLRARAIQDIKTAQTFTETTQTDFENTLVRGGTTSNTREQDILVEDSSRSTRYVENINFPEKDSIHKKDALESEKNIDYGKLQSLLRAGNWKEADRETYDVMLHAVGKKSRDLLTKDDLMSFPCQDLYTIDGLWHKYSKGKFSFSTQKKIYVECGAKLDGNYPGDEIWDSFCNSVGWRIKGQRLGYSQVVFDLSAPDGHLPEWVGIFGFCEPRDYSTRRYKNWGKEEKKEEKKSHGWPPLVKAFSSAIFYRLHTCNI
jgi:uncharacterized caspase-like protein